MDPHATDEDVMRVFVPTGWPKRQAAPATSRRSSPWRRACGVQVRHLRPSVPTLEDVFAKALGEE